MPELVLIHIGIGTLDAVHDAAVGILRRGKSHRDAQLVVTDAIGTRILLGIGDELLCLLRGRPRHEGKEFVTAHAEHTAILRQRLPHHAHAHADIFVADHMPVGIVDLFQIVAVSGNDAHRIGLFLLQAGDVFIEVAAVVQPGELVVDGTLPQRTPHELLFRDVVDECNDASDTAVRIEQRLLDELEKLLLAVVFLDDIRRPLAAADDLHICQHGELGVFLILADLKVSLAADRPVGITVRVQMVPRLGGEDIPSRLILQEDIGRERL